MPLEKSIQASVVKYARSIGAIAIKLSSLGMLGTSGWPDYIFLTGDARVFFIEFKRPGGKMSELQAARARDLAAHGFAVYLIDNVPLGKKVVGQWVFHTSRTSSS